MFDISWLDISILLVALLVAVGLVWVAARTLRRLLLARRRPREWDEHVLGRVPDRSRNRPDASSR